MHSGIASSDVICVRALGKFSSGDSHAEAVAVLKKADPALAPQLHRLLSLKAKAGYTHRPVSKSDVKAASKALESLLEAARIRMLPG